MTKAKTAEQKLKDLEKKYKQLSDKHRSYLMQEYTKKKQREQTFSKLKQIIHKLCKKIIELSSDEKLFENTEQIQEMLSTIKI